MGTISDALVCRCIAFYLLYYACIISQSQGLSMIFQDTARFNQHNICTIAVMLLALFYTMYGKKNAALCLVRSIQFHCRPTTGLDTFRTMLDIHADSVILWLMALLHSMYHKKNAVVYSLSGSYACIFNIDQTE